MSGFEWCCRMFLALVLSLALFVGGLVGVSAASIYCPPSHPEGPTQIPYFVSGLSAGILGAVGLIALIIVICQFFEDLLWLAKKPTK